MKTVLFSVILAIFARLTFAIPPACLLHAVNTQDEPSDLSAVCGDGALTVQSYMAENCGNIASDAQKAFIATCSSAGTSVASYTATATSTGRGSASGTGTVTSGSGSSGSATGSAGSAGSTQSTGAAYHYREGMGPMAAAAVALVGAVAAL